MSHNKLLLFTSPRR